MDISDSGRMFVTVGVRHVKFWYLELNNNNTNGASPAVMLQVCFLNFEFFNEGCKYVCIFNF